MMKNLRGFTPEELLSEVATLGEKPYRAEQIMRWVFSRRVADINAMTDISKAFRERLAGDYCVKGSALGCRFCMTGMSGFVRNLTLAELAGQVFSAYEILDEGEAITNIVLMGMGEPLANYDNVVRFIGVLTGNLGFHFSHNKVPLSTAGLVPAIVRLGQEETSVNLAVSLNATTDETRDRLMPINRKYPIKELIAALRTYPLKSRKYITIEDVLVAGVNDSDEDARRLARLLRGIPCKVNLIPFNPFPGSEFNRPSEDSVNACHPC